MDAPANYEDSATAKRPQAKIAMKTMPTDAHHFARLDDAQIRAGSRTPISAFLRGDFVGKHVPKPAREPDDGDARWGCDDSGHGGWNDTDFFDRHATLGMDSNNKATARQTLSDS